MKKTITLLSILFLLVGGLAAWAMEGHDMKGHAGHGDKMETDGSGTMAKGKTFKHRMTVDGLRGEFEVMSLAAMGMKPEGGNTHHIMVKFFKESAGDKVEKAKGKIKVITPSGKEQTGVLKNYSGVFAANFTFKEPGRHGVICLVKVDGRKHIYKFWYTHG